MKKNPPANKPPQNPTRFYAITPHEGFHRLRIIRLSDEQVAALPADNVEVFDDVLSVLVNRVLRSIKKSLGAHL